MRDQGPARLDIVLVGGGHAHCVALRRLAMAPIAGVRLTLINPEPTAVYTGMTPGLVAGRWRDEDAHVDLVRLAAFAGARFVEARAVGVDRAERRILLEGRAPVAYDLASLNIGAGGAWPEAPGAREHMVAVKPTSPLLNALRARAPSQVAILGAGLGGVELALALATRPVDPPHVTLIEARSEVAPNEPRGLRTHLRAALERAGVSLRLGATLVAADAGGVVLAGAERVRADLVIAAAGASAPAWLAKCGLACDAAGFVRVTSTLQIVGEPRLLAAGDCASLEGAPRPRAGVYAVRAGRVLAANLRRLATGRRLVAFRPQSRRLSLVTSGPQSAIASYGPFAAEGRWAARWKDRIDTRFMVRFADLPAMLESAAAGPADRLSPDLAPPDTERPGDPLACAGCAAKPSQDALLRGLAGLAAPRRADVSQGVGDDAALLSGPDGDDLIFTVDQFPAFLNDPYRLAQIAAVHAMGDVWAMGGTPQAALAIAVLPPLSARLQAETLRELTAGALAALVPAGADLLGGHTSQGDRLAAGFAVTGRVAHGTALTCAGARPGDLMILTKPLGTGVLFAGAMRGLAQGRWISHALVSMSRGLGKDAEILRAAGARALTDVTGYGVAGHALALARASGVAIALRVAAPTLLPGALELWSEGVRSSAHARNMAPFEAGIAPSAVEAPRTAAFFDPQTAGGLLAATPPDAAQAALALLQDAGIEAAIIGECLPLLPGAPLVRLS